MIGFFIGVVFGSVFGFMICALLTSGKMSDLYSEIAELKKHK